MRSIRRLSLTPETRRFLAKRSSDVSAAGDPRAEAKRLWRFQANKAFREARATLAEMAPGRSRCMYCEDSAGTDIEHFWPKSHYPGRAFTWENYLWACSYCNSNLKRTLFPLDEAGEPLLIDPTDPNVDPKQHLHYLPSSGRYTHIDKKGAETIRVFALNDDRPPRQLPTGRADAWRRLHIMLEEYDRCAAQREVDKAASTRRCVVNEPFSGVLVWLLHVASTPMAEQILGPSILRILNEHEVHSWLD